VRRTFEGQIELSDVVVGNISIHNSRDTTDICKKKQKKQQHRVAEKESSMKMKKKGK
jgi:hypothetical protein